MAEHHIVEDKLTSDYHTLLRCIDCDDWKDCGTYFDQKSYDEVSRNRVIFRLTHRSGMPRFPAVHSDHKEKING